MHGQLKWKTERPPSTNPKMPQIPAKCLKCLRSFMKHEQQKRKTRDVSSNEPEIAITAWKVPFLSSFVHEARKTEKEDFARFLQRTRNRGKSAWKMPFLSSFVHEARTTEKEDQRHFLQRTRNSRNCLKGPESVFVRE